MDNRLLELLKRSPGRETRQRGRVVSAFTPQLYFQAGARGACLRMIDVEGRTCDPDALQLSGPLRRLVQLWSAARESEMGAFDWQDDGHLESGVALVDHPRLMLLLKACPQVVDAAGKPLHFAPETRQLMLALAPTDAAADHYQAQFKILADDGAATPLAQPRLLDEGHLIEGDCVYSIEPLGGGFDVLPLFADRVPTDQLALFLTLFASNFPELAIQIEAFSELAGGIDEALPVLIFRDVDHDANLILDSSYKLAQLPSDFLHDYEISRVVHLDPSQQSFRIAEVDYRASREARDDLTRQLQRLSRKVKGAQSFLHFDEDGSIMLGADLAASFLAESLAEVATRFTLYGTEKLSRYKIVHARPKLQANLSSGIDFLEGDASLEIENERISLLDALSQFRKNAYIELSDGRHAVVDSDYMARLQRLFKKKKDRVRVSFFDLPQIDELMEHASEAAPFERSRELFRELNSLDQRKVPLRRFTGSLRPYQTDGLRWLDYLHAHRLGGCLADDMGLGKTVQAIALFSRIYPKTKKPSLIVMPRSLLFNWTNELTTFAPQLRACNFYGPGRNWEEACQHEIILTTYGTLRSDVETIAGTAFHALVLDESQAVKNARTQTSQAVCALKGKFRLALSGTPIENNLAELYALFRFLNPAMFPTFTDFDRDYIQPIQKTQDADAAAELRRKIYPFILRRLKRDVLKDLPAKVEQSLYVEMNEKQKTHYENRRRYYQQVIEGEIERRGLAQSQFAILEALLELRQIATVPESKTEGAVTSAKTERLLEALDEAIANGHKCLVFTNFLAGVEQVSEALGQREIPHLCMTGATSDRQALVERFQNNPAIKVFVMTLKTGGVGLNLTAADAVFILDPWWNQSAESQAVDRAHRIGQANTVFTYRLITRGTIEEKIQKLQSQKKELIDQIVTTDTGALKHLSEGDIESLFQD